MRHDGLDFIRAWITGYWVTDVGQLIVTFHHPSFSERVYNGLCGWNWVKKEPKHG